MRLVGRRTYAVCLVIAALALCRRALGLDVPPEVFLALFALALSTLRQAVSAACLGLLLALPSGGCSGYRSAVSTGLVAVRRPVFTVVYAPPACADTPDSPRDGRESASVSAPITAAGPVMLYAEQVQLMFFGGSAASNSTLSDLTIPLR